MRPAAPVARATRQLARPRTTGQALPARPSFFQRARPVCDIIGAMEKSRSLAILWLLALACLLLAACKTAGTPKEPDSAQMPPAGAPRQPDSTPAASRTVAGLQAPPRATAASQNVTAGYSRSAPPVSRGEARAVVRASNASVQPANAPAKATANTETPSATAVGEIEPARTVLYAAAPIFFVGLVGAVTTGLDGRRRRPAPSSASTRR